MHYSPLCPIYFQVNISCSSQWHFLNVNSYELFLSSHTLIYHQAAGNNDLRKDSPDILVSLLLLDIRLTFHLDALSHCLTGYTNGIPLSLVF